MFVFSVKDNVFSLPINTVKEVAELRRPVFVPKVADYVKGAIIFKGALYSIIDTATFFKLGAVDALKCNIIILSDNHYNIGFLAEHIKGAVDTGINKSDLGDQDDDFISGYFELGGKRVRVIDTEKVFKEIESNIDNINFNVTNE
jgi:chemotaxis signal transduction protein